MKNKPIDREKEKPQEVNSQRYIMVDVSDIQSVVCKNDISGSRHIRTGDLFLSIPKGEIDSEVVCFLCAEKATSLVEKIERANKNKTLLRKRDKMLFDWADHRKECLKLTRWSQRELDIVMAKITQECLNQSWSERLKEIRKQHEANL